MNYKLRRNIHDCVLLKLKVLWFAVCVILSTVACVNEHDASSQLILPSPDSYTQNFIEINQGNVLYLEQTDAFQIDYYDNTNYIFKYVLGGNKIVSCCSQDNEILVWDVFSGSILNKYTISNSNVLPYEFDTTGKWLLGKVETSLNSIEQDNPGLFVWDSATGKVKSCIWANCGQKPMYEYEISGAILESEGDLVIEFDNYEYFLYDVQRDSLIPKTALNCADCGHWWQIGKIAYDTVNNRYAIVFQEGRIQMDYLDWDASPTPSISKSVVLDYGAKHDLQNIYAAEFAPSGRYLAFVRGNILKVLEVEGKTAREKFKMRLNNGTGLVFDQTGSLLFIVSKDKIAVLDILLKDIIAEYYTPEIISISISGDNRLLIWGDKIGEIHILGIHK